MAENLTPSVEELREIIANAELADVGDVDLDEQAICLVDGTRLTEACAQQMAEDIIREHRGL